MNRRGFIAGMLAACAAPAVVKAASLMPVRAIIVPPFEIITLNQAFHVDTTFTMSDLTLSIDDFAGRILIPGWTAIANRIDRDMFWETKIAYA